MKLLIKEFRLCMHPTAYLMLGLSAMMLIPNYPYGVIFFYSTLSLFFICITARENHDAAYTLALPVSRKEMVKARIRMSCIIELVQIILCLAFVFVKRGMEYHPNEAGMDANLACIGEGFILFGLFHLIFFPMFYRDINKVGKAFAFASVAVFLYIIVSVVCTYAVPFVRDRLDTPDPEFMTEKLVFTAAAALWYVGATLATAHVSAKRFEKVDLQL